jgi:hypothetical protein
MKTKADLAYSDLKVRMQYGMLVFTEDPYENFKLLDSELNTINLAKCGLNDLEIEQRGAGQYLAYLFQSKHAVSFGVCPKVKMWFNHAGLQSRCQHEGSETPVRCQGCLNLCPFPSRKPK